MKYVSKLLFAMVVNALMVGVSLAKDKTIVISDVASYYNEMIIAPNIRNQCTNLLGQFSDSTEVYLKKKKWNVERSNNISDSGYYLELKVTNAHSSGNAWTGHNKSVSILANLYQDGELLDTYEGVRNSGGGFGAGFKGSCQVLGRCVNTLGKDVSKWLRKKGI